MDEKKQYLDYEGLSLYDSLIKGLIKSKEITLNDITLDVEKLTLTIDYTKGDEHFVKTLDLSSLATKWSEL